jgi:hypothetical protein
MRADFSLKKKTINCTITNFLQNHVNVEVDDFFNWEMTIEWF